MNNRKVINNSIMKNYNKIIIGKMIKMITLMI